MDKNIIHVDKTEYENILQENDNYKRDGKCIIIHTEYQDMYNRHRVVSVYSSDEFEEYVSKILAPKEIISSYEKQISTLEEENERINNILREYVKDSLKRKWWQK